MTGLEIVKQAYGLIGDVEHFAEIDGDERGLTAVNQIYGELWHREHRTCFQPLNNLRSRLQLTSHFLPAMAYGTAMLLCMEDKGMMHDRLLTLYRRAACHTGGLAVERRGKA